MYTIPRFFVSRWGPGTSKKNLPYEASFCLRLRRGQHHDGASGRQAGAGLLESVSWKKEEAKKTIAKLKPLHSSYMSYLKATAAPPSFA